MTELIVLEHVFVPLEILGMADERGNRRGSDLFLKRIGRNAEIERAKDPRIVASGYYSVVGGIATNVPRAPDFNAVLVGKPILFERLPSDFKPKFAESHKRQSNYWPVTFYQIDERQAENYRVRRAFASRDK